MWLCPRHGPDTEGSYWSVIEALESGVKTDEKAAARKHPPLVSGAIASVVMGISMCGGAHAASVARDTPTVSHALVLFAIGWLLASLRACRVAGRWCFGFELSPIKGLVDATTSRKAAKGGKRA